MSTTTQTIGAPTQPTQAVETDAVVSLKVIGRWAGTLFFVVVAFLLAGIFGLALYGFSHADRIYEGVHVGTVDVGGLNATEARAAVDAAYRPSLVRPVTLDHGGQAFAVSPLAAGIALDGDASVDQAFAVGRSGSIWARSQTWARSLLREVTVPAVLRVDPRQMQRALQPLAADVARPASDAYVQMHRDSEPTIVDDQPGVAFDLGSTANQLVQRVAIQSDVPVEVVAPALAARVTRASLESQLPAAQAAVATEFIISGLDKDWSIPPSDLKRIVAVSPDGEGIDVDRVVIGDLIGSLAKEIAHPTVNARVVVDERGLVSTIPSDQSVEVDVPATVNSLVGALERGEHAVAMSISRSDPAITNAQAEAARQQIETLVSGGLSLSWKGGNALLSREELLAAITIEQRPGDAEPFAIGFAPEVVGLLLQPLADSIYVPQESPRLRYVDGQVKIEGEAEQGRELDFDASVQTVIDAVLGKKGSAKLPITALEPVFKTTDLKKITFPDVLAESSTYYGTSSEARRKNIDVAVALETGWLVAPDEEFSYVQNIGGVTKEQGFVTGLGILDDGNGGITTAPVVGGGICQVSTTIFQAAFWAGMRIDERYSHPYWIQTYGEPPTGMYGLDAMVNIETTGSLDLRFTNTTGNWIAVVVLADEENVTARILGTDPGWTVDVNEPEVSRFVDPPSDTVITDSPELPEGEERQVETAQQGFDASVRRTVMDTDGTVIDEYTVSSTYGPSRNRILRGTGAADAGE